MLVSLTKVPSISCLTRAFLTLHANSSTVAAPSTLTSSFATVDWLMRATTVTRSFGAGAARAAGLLGHRPRATRALAHEPRPRAWGWWEGGALTAA